MYSLKQNENIFFTSGWKNTYLKSCTTLGVLRSEVFDDKKIRD